jgi:cell division protein FtsI (penicillin-binding protein 3)
MLVLYNAVANDGKMMRPYLVSAVKEHGMVVRTIEPQILVPKICSDETLVQARACLRAVVDSAHGTGHKVLSDTAYSISGKTGTAVTAMDSHGYNKGNKIYQASFIGFFPSDHPKYTMAVVIQNSKESKLIYGADVSGRVFKRISDHIYKKFLSDNDEAKKNIADTFSVQTFGMKSDLQSIFHHLNMKYVDAAGNGLWREVKLKGNNAELKPVSPEQSSTIPDVRGLGLKDAVYLLENKGLVAQVSGKGKVVSQSIPAGTKINKGQKILIVLN